MEKHELLSEDASKLWHEFSAINISATIEPRVPEQHLLYQTIKYYKPTKCIEFGYNMGHSALLILEALGDGGHLTSYDLNKTTQDKIKSAYDNFDYYIGDDVEKFEQCDMNDIDYAFIDAEQTYKQVTREINTVMPRLAEGGIIHFDNTNLDKDGNSPVLRAITENPWYASMREITNWHTGQHLTTPYYEWDGGFYRIKINRIYQKITP